MKVSHAAIPRKSANSGGFIRAPISIERPKELFSFAEEGSFLEMKLRSSPADESSPTYSLKMPIFKSGTAEQWFNWRNQFKIVLRGQNLTLGPDQFAMARRLLSGEALTRFNNEAAKERHETAVSLERCFQAVTDYVLPKFALAHQKRYLRRVCRKPADLTIKEYYARLKELNDYLALFNNRGAANKLQDDEIMEHLHFSIPNRWQKEMIMHGFEPIEKSIDDFLEFCERLEVAEGIYDATHKKPAGMPEIGSRPSKRKRSSQQSDANNNARGEYYCMYHGVNSSHNTDDCKLLKPQVEKMKACHESTKQFRSNKKARFNRPSGMENKNDRSEYNGFTDKRPNNNKKRQRSQSNVRDLDNFNYGEFNQLRIEESDRSDDDSN